MITTKEIAWLAGILEGEGAFMMIKSKAGRTKRPIISLNMTDRDVVAKAAALFGMTVSPPRLRSKPHHKPIYRCEVSGSKAIGWMMTIYSLMGERRKTKIRELIKAWKESELYRHAPKGSFLPSICHPEKHRAGNGLCSTCYMRQYRKFGGAKKNENWGEFGDPIRFRKESLKNEGMLHSTRQSYPPTSAEERSHPQNLPSMRIASF